MKRKDSRIDKAEMVIGQLTAAVIELGKNVKAMQARLEVLELERRPPEEPKRVLIVQ